MAAEPVESPPASEDKSWYCEKHGEWALQDAADGEFYCYECLLRQVEEIEKEQPPRPSPSPSWGSIFRDDGDDGVHNKEYKRARDWDQSEKKTKTSMWSTLKEIGREVFLGASTRERREEVQAWWRWETIASWTNDSVGRRGRRNPLF